MPATRGRNRQICGTVIPKAGAECADLQGATVSLNLHAQRVVGAKKDGDLIPRRPASDSSRPCFRGSAWWAAGA